MKTLLWLSATTIMVATIKLHVQLSELPGGQFSKGSDIDMGVSSEREKKLSPHYGQDNSWV